jgi:S-adenosylmethionine synthetase
LAASAEPSRLANVFIVQLTTTVMSYLFTSESVSEGHPDKVADQISDAILDEFLRQDPEAKVACETFVSTGLAVIGGEVHSDAYVDIQSVARRVINRIGYTKAEYMFDGNSCGILSAIHEQSPDINRGVVTKEREEQGAGDQGMMFGYACRDTEEFMPLPLTLSHIALIELAKIRKETALMPYLRPDAKSQFTIEYSDHNLPLKVHTIVISTQHDEFDSDEAMQLRIKSDVKNILIPRVISRLPEETQKLFDTDYTLHVNPTGKFVIGGPHGDTGLTGRKIIVDTYGGKGAHGGGAFSGKDPSKVDRSAAYAARHIAKNLVAAGVADEVLVQLAYAIGVARPVSVFVNTYGTAFKNNTAKFRSDGEIADLVSKIFDLRPAKIIERFGLKKPIYEVTAAYGHMGRDPFEAEVELGKDNGNSVKVKEVVQFFSWEKLDSVELIKEAFDL